VTPTMATQTRTQRQAAARKAAATRKRNAARSSRARTRGSARATRRSAGRTAASARKTATQATRSATRRAEAETAGLRALRHQAERALLIPVGAAVAARDALADVFGRPRGLRRQLDRFERRGETALRRNRRQAERHVRAARRDVQRGATAVRRNRRRAERQVRAARRDASAAPAISNRTPSAWSGGSRAASTAPDASSIKP
jgi:hypothetical protein